MTSIASEGFSSPSFRAGTVVRRFRVWYRVLRRHAARALVDRLVANELRDPRWRADIGMAPKASSDLRPLGMGILNQ